MNLNKLNFKETDTPEETKEKLQFRKEFGKNFKQLMVGFKGEKEALRIFRRMEQMHKQRTSKDVKI